MGFVQSLEKKVVPWASAFLVSEVGNIRVGSVPHNRKAGLFYPAGKITSSPKMITQWNHGQIGVRK